MSSPDLASLFTAPVSYSSGFVEPPDVPALSQLQEGEVPDGFNEWAEKRRREFRAGRHHARAALQSAGIGAGTIRRDSDGVPLFPRGYQGSITHTGRKTTFAAAAVTKSSSHVGLDAETIRDFSESVISYVIKDDERSHLERRSFHPALEGLQGAALLVFSAKEAFYKCVFPRLRQRFGFHDLRFHAGQSDGEFLLSVRHPKEWPTVPHELAGRFIVHDAQILCGVTWRE